MRALFPLYYMVGIVSGTIAIAIALFAHAGLLLTVPLVICLVLVTYARQVVTPAVNEAREADDAERFARLHVLSVRLNMVVLALLLLAGTVLAKPGGPVGPSGQGLPG
jgi:peptidoglycan biosynthesis protein MviN/MurJ (putative lipid II flippase)